MGDASSVSTLSHLRELIAEHDRRYTELREADQKALSVAFAEANRRLDEMNNLREQINRERNTFATKDAIATLEDRVTRSEGRKGGLNQAWGYIIGFIGIAAAIVTLFVQ